MDAFWLLAFALLFGLVFLLLAGCARLAKGT